MKKPYLKGAIFDTTVIKSCLAMAGCMLIMMLAYLLLGIMMIFDNRILSIILNAVMLGGVYMVFYASGMARGSTAVNEGEILYRRKETNREISKVELDTCYHPLKGFLIGLLGTLPYFLISLVFAFITTRQMTSVGALPSWVSAMTGRTEVLAPLSYYTSGAGLSVTDIMRIFVRMNVMPYVNMFNSSDMDAMFLLERIAPVLILIPGLCYGYGYTRGESVRTKVHADIALGKKKLAKKQRREKKRRLQPKEPTKLN